MGIVFQMVQILRDLTVWDMAFMHSGWVAVLTSVSLGYFTRRQIHDIMPI